MSFIEEIFTLCQESACFALLDDASSAANPAARLYYDLETVLQAQDGASLDALCHATESALKQGYFAVAALSYETGASLYEITPHQHAEASRVLIFRQKAELDRAQTEALLALQLQRQPNAGIANLQANVGPAEFSQAIEKIRDYIAAGDTYQVNYTYRWHAQVYGAPLSLYARLRQRQAVPYGACLQFADGSAIVSCSPELFIQRQGSSLRAKPMKGTAAASADAAENQRRALALSQDIKNRAENLMIVDLLRNDLGQIAKTGSVKVPALFEVSRYSQVLQMTSTVEAEIAPATQLSTILHALFPCGSITGAPKKRTMQIIREIEPAPRGVYTGALGWLEADSDSPLNFCFSVPIRTLQLTAPALNENGLSRTAVLGVGAGIVYDSVAAEEWQECLLKAHFLTQLTCPFGLIETMRIEDQECLLWPRHKQRLLNSAAWFGIAIDSGQLEQAFQQQRQQLAPQTTWRLRVELDVDGQLHWQHGVLTAFANPVKVRLGGACIVSHNPLIRHKTSARAIYDQAWQDAEQHSCFDTLLFNERDELVEGGRSNVILRLNGVHYTPPVSSGLLPGVMRAHLLADSQWQIQQRVLTRAEVLNAECIYLCNALRGVFAVTLDLSD